MKDNTKIEIEKRNVGRLDGGNAPMGNKATRESDYIATSPGAAYNHGRNIRAIDKKMNERNDLVTKHQNGMMLGSDDGEIVATSDQDSVARDRKH